MVWDPVTQRGFMHFAGLCRNDPAAHQYQLWIFDGARDKRYPVDGGVFDVPANTKEIVIPIRAALMVLKPAAFAVTVEKPGGAVVSGREHVVVLGAAARRGASRATIVTCRFCAPSVSRSARRARESIHGRWE